MLSSVKTRGLFEPTGRLWESVLKSLAELNTLVSHTSGNHRLISYRQHIGFSSLCYLWFLVISKNMKNALRSNWLFLRLRDNDHSAVSNHILLQVSGVASAHG